MTDVLRRAYERVDLAAGTVRVDLRAIEDWQGRLQAISESMEQGTAAFRTVGLTGPADLVARWLADVDEARTWLFERLREFDVATELAGVADARGITVAQALEQITGKRAHQAQQEDRT
jgi:hypothetical protein